MLSRLKMILSIFIVGLFVLSCDTMSLYETDTYTDLIGTWSITSITYPDVANWPDTKNVFTADGYFKIYHSHDGTEYLTGTWKVDDIDENFFSSTYHTVGECNVTYHNSDWIDGAKMYNWYGFVDQSTLKLGWTDSQKNYSASEFELCIKQ